MIPHRGNNDYSQQPRYHIHLFRYLNHYYLATPRSICVRPYKHFTSYLNYDALKSEIGVIWSSFRNDASNQLSNVTHVTFYINVGE